MNNNIRLISLTALMLFACDRNNKPTPSKVQIDDNIRLNLPAFLTLESDQFEVISTGTDSVKIKFKAEVSPKEDLYKSGTLAEQGISTITIVQAKGAKKTLYGSFDAIRNVDKWNFDKILVEEGTEQFGIPKGGFGLDVFVSGSSELANEISKQKEQNAAILAKQESEAKEKAAQLMKEQAEAEAKTKAEAEAFKAKLLAATAPGKKYRGTYIAKASGLRLPVRVEIIEQTGSLVKAVFSVENKNAGKREFSGTLDLTRRKVQGQANTSQIQLSSPYNDRVSPQAYNHDVFDYTVNCHSMTINLNISEDGLAGEARTDNGISPEVLLQSE